MQDLLVRIGIAAVVTVGYGLLLFLGQLAIERVTPRRPGEARMPSYVGAVGLVSGAMGGLCLALGMLGGMSAARDDFLAWVGLVVAFCGGGLYLVVAAGNWRMWIDDAGIQVRTEVGRTSPFLPWNQIAEVRATWTQYIVFDSRDGVQLKAPMNTPGILDVIMTARRHGASVSNEMIEALRSYVGPSR